MASEVLKEFLVALSYKIEGNSERRFTESLTKATLQAKLLGDALEAAARSMVNSVANMARSMEGLYYESQRTRSSAAALQAFGYAASQTGSSVEEANSAVENLGRLMRSNRGYEGMLRSWGVQTRDRFGAMRSDVLLTEDVVKKIQTSPLDLAESIRGALNMPENLFLSIRRNAAEFDKLQADSLHKNKVLGFDPNEAAANAHGFMVALRDLGDTIGKIGDSFEAQFLPDFTEKLKSLNAWLLKDGHGDQISKTLNSIAKAILAVVDAVAAWLGKKDTQDQIDDFAKHLKDAKIDETVNKWLKPFRELKTILDEMNDVAEWLDIISNKDGKGEKALKGWADRTFGSGGTAPGSAAAPLMDERNWWQRTMPSWAGGKDAPVGGKLSDAPGIGLKGRRWSDATQPSASGTYRPKYNLSDADVSAAVVNTIAGEARVNDPNSVDAVINNMLNRVGTHGWGPSGNLQEVARAPGQYAGYRRASQKEAEFIRQRIQAIASGGVPDNTSGSNAYRAGYYRGPWFRKHQDAPVVGGNRFAYDPSVRNGPYAPYEKPHVAAANAVTRAIGTISNAVGVGAAKAAEAIKGAPPVSTLPSGRLAAFASQPMTTSNVWNTPSTHIAPTTNVTINSHGSDPDDLSLAFGRMARRQNADLIRNVQNATQ